MIFVMVQTSVCCFRHFRHFSRIWEINLAGEIGPKKYVFLIIQPLIQYFLENKPFYRRHSCRVIRTKSIQTVAPKIGVVVLKKKLQFLYICALARHSKDNFLHSKKLKQTKDVMEDQVFVTQHCC